MFIGVTGPNSSGKDEVANYLAQKGFNTRISLSDMLREEADRRGIQKTVDNLVKLGNELRAERGSGVLAKMAVEKILPPGFYFAVDESEWDVDKNSKVRAKTPIKNIIVSIRHPAEVDTLREHLQRLPLERRINSIFYLIAVDAPFEQRYQQFLKRARVKGEEPSEQEFMQMDERAMGVNQPESGQQLGQVMPMANYTIQNASDLPDLHTEIDSALKAAKQYRLDVSYMMLALQMSARGDCIKRKLGAAVIKDDWVLAMGFNGSPRSVKNCNEGGCERCNDPNIPSGEQLDRCSCVHAEKNTILQAAYHGIALKDGVIYTSLYPCVDCAKSIIQAGIRGIVYCEGYPQQSLATELFKQAGIKVKQLRM